MLKKLFYKDLNNRIGELDIARFVALILMTLSHLTYLAGLFWQIWFYDGHLAPDFFAFCRWGYFFYSDYNYYISIPCATLFVCVSGITSSFSSKPLIKSIKFVIISAIITLVTFVVQLIIKSEVAIWLGIIHLHALCMLIYCGFDALWRLIKRKKNIQSDWIFIIVLLLLGAGLIIFGAFAGLFINTPKASTNYFFVFGYYSKTFYSGDYYPLIPWLGVFFVGAGLGKLFYKDKKSYLPVLTKVKPLRPILFLSAHSLEYYFVHIGVIALILLSIGLICGLPLPL